MIIVELILDWLGIRKRWNLTVSEKARMYFDDHLNFNIPKYNLALLKVHKVASTSIWRKSAALNGYPDVKRDQMKTLKLPEFSSLELAEQQDIFKAAFVRNPWDRLLSCYLQKKLKNRKDFFLRNGLKPEMTFEQFVERVCEIPEANADVHFRSQFLTLVNHKGDFLVDFIGQFERLDKDFEELAVKAGIKDSSLPVANPTQHASYETYYTQSMSDAVSKRYQIDLRLFGYEFGNPIAIGIGNPKDIEMPLDLLLQILSEKCAKMIHIITRIQIETSKKNSSRLRKLKRFLLGRSTRQTQDVLEPYSDHRNIYLEEYKLLFYKIPKVGSTSIWHISAELLGHQVRKENLRSMPLEYLPFYLIEDTDKVRKVAFVRNPWDRLVSCFCQKKERKNVSFFNTLSLTPEASFQEFVDAVCTTSDDCIQHHLRSQYTYLIDHNANWVVDFVGKFESFEEDLFSVLNRQEVKLDKFPHWNKIHRSAYTSYYTPELQDKVAKRYHLDIELFGYKYGASQDTVDKPNLTEALSNEIKYEVLLYKSQRLMNVLRQMAKD